MHYTILKIPFLHSTACKVCLIGSCILRFSNSTKCTIHEIPLNLLNFSEIKQIVPDSQIRSYGWDRVQKVANSYPWHSPPQLCIGVEARLTTPVPQQSWLRDRQGQPSGENGIQKPLFGRSCLNRGNRQYRLRPLLLGSNFSGPRCI